MKNSNLLKLGILKDTKNIRNKITMIVGLLIILLIISNILNLAGIICILHRSKYTVYTPVNNNKYSNIKVYSLKIVCKVNIKDNDSKIIGINCDRVLILYIKNIITTMK